MKEKIKDIIASFAAISLEEINNSVALMKRTDTKFVITKPQLFKVFEVIKNDYRVLEINSDRIMTYSSLYFDTANNEFYNHHHNGKNNRTKIRQRKI